MSGSILTLKLRTMKVMSEVNSSYLLVAHIKTLLQVHIDSLPRYSQLEFGEKTFLNVRTLNWSSIFLKHAFDKFLGSVMQLHSSLMLRL